MNFLIGNTTTAQLCRAGYLVEDMGEEHGPGFAGQYRWMHDDSETWGAPESTEQAAWEGAAKRHASPTPYDEV